MKRRYVSGGTAVLAALFCLAGCDDPMQETESTAIAENRISDPGDLDGPGDVDRDPMPLAAPGSCATLFEHINFGGDRREVDSGAYVPWIGGPWNDQVSSLDVRPGCVLNAYEHIDFGGALATYQGSVPWVGEGWNDRISSYTCSC